MPSIRSNRNALFAVALALICGCRPGQPATPGLADARSDPDRVRSADFSILYVGNSDTGLHNLPGLIADMIRYLQAALKVGMSPDDNGRF